MGKPIYFLIFLVETKSFGQNFNLIPAQHQTALLFPHNKSLHLQAKIYLHGKSLGSKERS